MEGGISLQPTHQLQDSYERVPSHGLKYVNMGAGIICKNLTIAQDADIFETATKNLSQEHTSGNKYPAFNFAKLTFLVTPVPAIHFESPF